jgi:hypothetical protein
MKTSAKTRGATTHQKVSLKPQTVSFVLSSVIRVHSRLFAVPSASFRLRLGEEPGSGAAGLNELRRSNWILHCGQNDNDGGGG